MFAIIASFSSGIFFGINFYNPNIIRNKNINIEVRFSPQDDCLNKIIHEIMQAKKIILIQTYSFTSKDITEALIAQSKNGIKIILIADHSQINNLTLYKLKSHGIDILIDKLPGIAHNKIIIIDDHTVLTGSFNFSHAAQYRNAENSLTIHSKQLAKVYQNNFWYRYSQSKFL